jgi:hypothetical protein
VIAVRPLSWVAAHRHEQHAAVWVEAQFGAPTPPTITPDKEWRLTTSLHAPGCVLPDVAVAGPVLAGPDFVGVTVAVFREMKARKNDALTEGLRQRLVALDHKFPHLRGTLRLALHHGAVTVVAVEHLQFVQEV